MGDGVQNASELREVTVVNAAGLHLGDQFLEMLGPASSARHGLDGYTLDDVDGLVDLDRDDAVDDLDGPPVRVRRSALFPGPVPARGRAPLSSLPVGWMWMVSRTSRTRWSGPAAAAIPALGSWALLLRQVHVAQSGDRWIRFVATDAGQPPGHAGA